MFETLANLCNFKGMVLNPDDSTCLPSRYEVSDDKNYLPVHSDSQENSFTETTVINNIRLTAETHFQVFLFWTYVQI